MVQTKICDCSKTPANMFFKQNVTAWCSQSIRNRLCPAKVFRKTSFLSAWIRVMKRLSISTVCSAFPAEKLGFCRHQIPTLCKSKCGILNPFKMNRYAKNFAVSPWIRQSLRIGGIGCYGFIVRTLWRNSLGVT